MLVDFTEQDNMRPPVRAVAIVSLAFAAVVARGSLLDDTPSRFATLDGVRIHYKLAGRGRTAIVFVHGFAGDMSVWREQVPFFANSARVVVLDLPGHGQSDKPQTDYTMKFMARAIRAVLDDARVDRAVLVGHSAGTAVIRQFDRTFPWRTRALVAVDGALTLKAPAEAGQKAIAAMRADTYRDGIASMFDAMMPVASAELRDSVKRSATTMPQHVAVSFTSAMFDPSNWKDDRIVVPLLVINQGGPMWSADDVTAVRALAEDVDYQAIDGVDHFLMLEKPADFNKRLETWLTKKKLLR